MERQDFNLYDYVLLKDGHKAVIVEFLGNDYVVDIDLGGDYDTDLVKKTDIQAKVDV